MSTFPQSLQTPVIAEATVVDNQAVCREHYRLILSHPNLPDAYPGQFVHITMSLDSQAGAGANCALHNEMTVRRAFSIAGLARDRAGAQIQLLYRVVGKATRWMAALGAKDRVNVLGPLGNQLTIANHKRLALLVAGGIGLPPMLWWSQALRRKGIETIAFCGAQTRDLMPLIVQPGVVGENVTPTACAQEFAAHGVETVLATDDGTLGFQGLVTDALDAYLDRRRVPADSVCIYSCGPEPMMRAVSQIATQRGLDCHLCMERSMACGMGTCQSCVVPVTCADAVDGWRYLLCCTDGPVFSHEQILWAH